MNVFILDNNLQESAKLLADQHLGKQILEIAQILCTAQSLNGYNTPYKPTHKNHPVVKWAMDNKELLLQYSHFLNTEFQYRRQGKGHKSHRVIRKLARDTNIVRPYIKIVNITNFPISNDLPYYRSKLLDWLYREKPLVATWTRRDTPDWYKQLLEATYE